MEEKNQNKTKKKFNLFDWYYNKSKASDKKDINVLKEPTLGNFFKITWNKIGKLLSANLIFIIGNFPIFFLLLAISGLFDDFSPSPLYQSWAPLNGIATHQTSPVISIFNGILGAHGEMRTLSVATYVFLGLGLLIIFTWGLVKVGTTYIYRNLMNGEAVFPLSDFFYIIKKNIKQGLLIGIIDAVITLASVYNIYFLFTNFNASVLNQVMFFMTVAMFLVCTMIRPYVYIMTFTFDLSIGKIIKNALYFFVLGIKRNLLALLGIVLLVAINVGLVLIPYLTPLGAILPFIITIAIADFMGVYAAYPNIIKYMMNEEDAKALIERKFNFYDDEQLEELPEASQDSDDDSEEVDNQCSNDATETDEPQIDIENNNNSSEN